MDNIIKKVSEEINTGWTGSNSSCSYYPCHFKEQDCTFCYCPFYPCNDTVFGKNIKGRTGKEIWECTDCLFIHKKEVGKHVMSEIKRMNITDPKDSRINEIFHDAKEKFYHEGKALMILGTSSDAGKSFVVISICRILHNYGHLIAPFKSQNMSLNSKVTPKGHEVAMIQALQATAAGLKNPSYQMNPILLKPMGNYTSEVIVEGKPFGEYTVEEYYDDFIPNEGSKIVKDSMDFLKKRYDFVIMEGAGSPAEINIYDKDIANMRAAEIADASCILVVNTRWGGSFAHAIGTLELMKEEDRKRVKGLIINNVHGNPEKLKSIKEEFEKVIGIPVVGIIPQLDVRIPTEDSAIFREKTSMGNGKLQIAVVKLPRISHFTDFDPLFMEDVTIYFVTDPKKLSDMDGIIIPDTKNIVSDYIWMKENGMTDAILKLKGKVPILGICGGYQMMGKTLKENPTLKNLNLTEMEGLGLFDMETDWSGNERKVANTEGVLIETGEPITGYEVYTGISTSNEDSLFETKKRFTETEHEGSVRKEDKLFGTNIHGVFEKTAFRRYFMSFMNTEKISSDFATKDYNEDLEENLQKLAVEFEKHLDMDILFKIMGIKK